MEAARGCSVPRNEFKSIVQPPSRSSRSQLGQDAANSAYTRLAAALDKTLQTAPTHVSLPPKTLSAVLVMVECQACGRVGHQADVCPSKTACQGCKMKGHSFLQCPKRAAPDDEQDGDDEEEEEAEHDACSECAICEAEADQPCTEDCANATIREIMQSQKVAKPPPAKKPKKVAASSTTTPTAAKSGVSLTHDGILAMPHAKLCELKHAQILAIPQVWRAWISARKTASERVEAHRKLMAALEAFYRPEDASTSFGATLSFNDLHRAQSDLADLSDLLDPAPNMGADTVSKKVQTAIEKRGQELISFRAARDKPWKTVRRAQEFFKGVKLQDKDWALCLARAAKEKTASAKEASPASPRSPRGGKRPRKGG